jgi:3-oxoadipate CoA-transferase beta subunit
VRPLTREQIAWRAAQDLEDGAYVNLGLGMPVGAAAHMRPGCEVMFHSENGIIGVGPVAAGNAADADLVDAGSQTITLVPGAAIFSSVDAFAMIRGGHVGVSLLGAFQVSAAGDLANWHTGEPDAIPAVGGAMDLAAGAKKVLVMMEHVTKSGESKIVERCTYPLTGVACVNRIYTDLAVIDVRSDGLHVIDVVEGLSFEELQRLTAAPLRLPASVT